MRLLLFLVFPLVVVCSTSCATRSSQSGFVADAESRLGERPADKKISGALKQMTEGGKVDGQLLLKLLRDDDDQVKCLAMEVFSYLSGPEERRMLKKEWNAIREIIVAHLNSNNESLRASAAWASRMFASENDRRIPKALVENLLSKNESVVCNSILSLGTGSHVDYFLSSEIALERLKSLAVDTSQPRVQLTATKLLIHYVPLYPEGSFLSSATPTKKNRPR